MPNRSNFTEFEHLYVEMQRKISAEWHRRLDPLISGSQAAILRKLEQHGPQKISTLAEGLCITPGAVTSLSDKLISNGYAQRKRGTGDRRVVQLEITDQGLEVLRLFKAEIKNTINHFFAGLSDEDINHLLRIFQQVLENIEIKK